MAEPFPLFADPRYPGNGLPPREQDRLPKLDAWARLAAGQPLGKKANLAYDAAVTEAQYLPETLIEIQGSDYDACPIIVTLTGPYAIPRAQADLPIDRQNMTGEFSNATVGAADYPGEGAPIVWPAFCAIVEWGTGGNNRAVAYVDWRQGQVICVPASYLRVYGVVPPDAAANLPGTSGVYALGAFASLGSPRSRHAQRTVFLGTVAASGDSEVFAVPPFAERATVVCLDAGGNVTTATLNFWRSPDGTQPAGSFFQTGNQPIGFLVPNGAAYFSINSGMGADAQFAVCFDLSI